MGFARTGSNPVIIVLTRIPFYPMTCHICVGPMDTFAQYDCTHRICLLCAARLVFLYKKTHCPLCMQPAEHIVFSSSETVQPSSEPIAYGSSSIRKTVQDLLANRCQKCPREFPSIAQLKKHYLDHGVILCSECINHRRDFWNEIRLYRSDTIRMHKNGSLQEEGFHGHVYCIHCRIHLFDAEDAKKHCILKHELCSLCDMLGTKYQYYSSFDDLETHYRNAHYCCTFQDCQQNKCFAYPYKTELFEHMSRFHRLGIKISSIPDSGRCSLPVTSPFVQQKPRIQTVVLDPNGRTASAPECIQRISPSSRASETLPAYLDRGALAEEKLKQRRRRFWMDRICKAEADEVERIVDAFLTDTQPVNATFDQIAALVGGESALKLFESIHFDAKQTAVSENIRAFRKSILFPRFTPAAPVRYEEPEHRSPGFRVIDLRKRK